MKRIKFSHLYEKIPICSKCEARLLQLFVIDASEISDSFRIYDTKYLDPYTFEEKYYPLPLKGKVIVLLFFGNNVLFTTIRRYTPNKFQYYNSLVGELLKMEIS